MAAALAFYIEYPITLHPIDVTDTVELAARYNLSAYDAAYLRVGRGPQGATRDLRCKARRSCRVHSGLIDLKRRTARTSNGESG